jgi:hypothetical protein
VERDVRITYFDALNVGYFLHGRMDSDAICPRLQVLSSSRKRLNVKRCISSTSRAP